MTVQQVVLQTRETLFQLFSTSFFSQILSSDTIEFRPTKSSSQPNLSRCPSILSQATTPSEAPALTAASKRNFDLVASKSSICPLNLVTTLLPKEPPLPLDGRQITPAIPTSISTKLSKTSLDQSTNCDCPKQSELPGWSWQATPSDRFGRRPKKPKPHARNEKSPPNSPNGGRRLLAR
jgi:hypothetical protein